MDECERNLEYWKESARSWRRKYFEVIEVMDELERT